MCWTGPSKRRAIGQGPERSLNAWPERGRNPGRPCAVCLPPTDGRPLFGQVQAWPDDGRRGILRRQRRRVRVSPASRARPTVKTSCGVLVGEIGQRLLLGQAGLSPRWDIPKGLAEAGESWAAAASRELREETGLVAEPEALAPLGVHCYLSGKQLALFAWQPAPMPDPATLRCTSLFRARDGRMVPEFVRFAILPWPEALARVGKGLARVLAELAPP